jgi:hypothetical protein
MKCGQTEIRTAELLRLSQVSADNLKLSLKSTLRMFKYLIHPAQGLLEVAIRTLHAEKNKIKLLFLITADGYVILDKMLSDIFLTCLTSFLYKIINDNKS